MSLTGNVGRVGLIKKDMLPALLNQRVARIRPDESKVLKRYLFNILNTELFEQAAISSSSGIAQKNLSTEWLKTYEIPLPPIGIQREIAAALDSYQKIIDAAQQIVKTYKPIIEISQESQFQKIGDFAQIKGGKRLPKGDSFVENQTSHPYLRVVDMIDGTINQKNLCYISEATFSKISPYIITQNDVYISIAGTIGRVGIVPSNLDGSSLTENAARLVFDTTRILPKFLSLELNSPQVQEQIKKSTMGVGVPKLALSRIAGITVLIPPVEVQREIVTQLEVEQGLIDANKELIEIYQKKMKDKISEVWEE
jgi:type I restriction enzyme S subunit